MENESIEDIIRAERESEKYCDACGLEMNLIKGKRRNSEWDKPHDKYVCICGNEFRIRSFNEILRDIGEKE